jgi:hypothetical protein
VAEYFYVVYEQRTLIQNPETGQNELLPKGVEAPEGVLQQRQVDVRRVKWAVINAAEVLDEEDWDGRFIPIIPVIGKEYNVDGESVYKGVISNAKDAQRLYNYARSSQAMAVGLAPLAPWVMAEGQDEGYELMWDEANTRAFTRLKYKPTSFEGNLLPPPQRNTVEPAMQAITMMAREADGDIQATTGRFNPSLGKQDSNRSGTAINALKQQGESSSSNYLENLATISMNYEGRILLDLLPHVYDRPGRIARLLGDDPKDEREVMLNQPFIVGPEGKPLPTTPGTPGLISTVMNKLRGNKPAEPPTFYDLNDGDYSVTVTVGQSFATQKDANAALLTGLMQSAPQMTPILADIYAEQLDGPMAERIVKRLQRMNPQLSDDEDAQPTVPPQLQQQMQQLQQQNQQLQQQLQQLQSGAQVEQMKIAGQTQIKQMEIDSRERIAAAQIRADVTKAQAQVASKEGIETLKVEAKRGELGAQFDHEHELQSHIADNEAQADVRSAALTPQVAPMWPKEPKVYTPPTELNL